MDKSKYFAAAEKAAQKGQFDKAIEAFEIILKADPYDLKALSRVADIYLKEDRVEKGVECLKRIGDAYTRDGFHSKAVATFKRILKLDKPPSRNIIMETHEKLASLYGQLGLVSDAMSHFAIVVDFYDQIGDQATLLGILKKVSDLDPNNLDIQLKLVDLFMSQGKMEEALDTLSSIESAARSSNSLSDIIRIQEKVIDHFPNDIEKLKSLAELLVKSNEPKRALSKIQLAFKAQPKNPEILELLSSTFQALRQPEKAKAVDIELNKLYKQLGDEEKAAEVEGRLQREPTKTVTVSSEPTNKSSPALEDPLDPVDSLIKALPLTSDEKKVLSECDVYFKYGLAEKAYEVLRGKLAQFPHSLILRWKLKAASQDMKKSDEAAHLLSEIIMLAQKQNLEIWANLAATELRALDPQHPALKGMKDKPKEKIEEKLKPVEEIKSAAALKKTSPPSPQVESLDDQSEFSIVLEDEDNQVDEISFADLNDFAEPAAPPPPKVEVKSPASKPVNSQAPKRVDEETIELEMEEASAPIDLDFGSAQPPTEVATDEASENTLVLQEASDGPDLMSEDILSESDFTMEELNALDGNLKPEEPKVKGLNEISAFELVDQPSHNESTEVIEDPDFEVKQSLEEYEFFKSQNLQSEADAVLKSLKLKFPQHPLVVSASKLSPPSSSVEAKDKKTAKVEALGRKFNFHVQEDQDDAGDFVDLASELDAEMSREGQTPSEIRDVFDAFKKGVQSTISVDDWQTHMDLGIAYREMGLFEDAYSEFKLVSQIPEQKASALYQMGLTKTALNQWQDAEKHFSEALATPSIQSQERLSVSYELGEVLLKLNRKDNAKKLFQEILKSDPDFREVSLKVKALG